VAASAARAALLRAALLRSGLLRAALLRAALLLVAFAGFSGEAVASEDWTVGDEGHAATLLDDGSVLLTGGWEGFDEVLPTAQRYIPSTESLLDLEELS